VYEYENIAYLDLQKTGTTTIVYALRELLAEEEIYADVHGPIPSNFDRNKNCFVSIREPLSTYISLFNFGCGSKKGTLYHALRKKSLEHYYERTLAAFERWLEFVLDPTNATLLGGLYAKQFPFECAGLMTFRLLYLSIPRSIHRLAKCSKNQDLSRLLERKRRFSQYVRTEHLYDDLFQILRHWEDELRLKSPLTSADDLVASLKTRNVSQKIDGLAADAVSPRMRQLVREREWLIYQEFGYDAHAKGAPPPCAGDERKSAEPRNKRLIAEARSAVAAPEKG